MTTKNKSDSLTLGANSRELLRQSDRLVTRSQALGQVDVQRVMVNAVKTDLKVGLTFAGIALQTREPAKRLRNKTKARVAYDTVMRYCKTLHLSDEDKVEILARQAELRAALQQLGESF